MVDSSVDEREPIKNFNIQTMSGIYPGSRTMVYQRLRLRNHTSEAGSTGQWYQLQWYSEPTSAVLFSVEGNQPTTTAQITLTEPRPATFATQLHEALAQTGLQADTCFACRHWQALNGHTEDGIPTGRCRWQDTNAELPAEIATQSALSLACDAFDRNDQPPSAPSTEHQNLRRVPKSAELDPDRLPFWSRLWHRLRHGNKPTQHWASDILERSGVGAGTEPCFVCQGRLANLGALAVASPEGDKQTFSVWRCRSCYTTYLNDWTDRWERLDSLETEELYFRVAPAEAYAALRIIHATKGGEHPGRRADRHKQRDEMLLLVAKKIPLSHQVRQGR